MTISENAVENIAAKALSRATGQRKPKLRQRWESLRQKRGARAVPLADVFMEELKFVVLQASLHKTPLAAADGAFKAFCGDPDALSAVANEVILRVECLKPTPVWAEEALALLRASCGVMRNRYTRTAGADMLAKAVGVMCLSGTDESLDDSPSRCPVWTLLPLLATAGVVWLVLV